ncbi:MAG: protein kinase [Gemmatimonadota bacterium]
MSPLERLTAALADRYRLDRELGQGGMATVYLAHDLKHDRDVAIKVLHPDLGAALGSERFLSEIRTTARLQHPHILPLLDSGEADGLLYYVMPLVTGETLRARLDREQQLPINDAIVIAREVADALGYAHGLGVIHRDIKPENILLQGGHALVADFGIALAVQSAGGARMTQTGLSLGTPQYMSPEQAMGERAIDARSDIYALGAVCYEMLVGEPPFTGPSVQAIVARLITEEPRAIAAQRKAVPEQIDATVMRALEKLPADRFASAAEFIASLAGAVGTSSVTRSTRAVVAHAGPWRRISALLAVVSVAALAVAAWTLTRGSGAQAPLVFDAAMPDTAAISFAASTNTTTFGTGNTNLTLSPDGRFVVYPVARGDSTVLWHRDLRDGSGHAIPGTEGAGAPRLSPDGKWIAFVVNGKVMLIPTAGGQARRLVEELAPVTLEWISATRLMMIHNQGYLLSWVDIDAGASKSVQIPRCLYGRWLADEKLILCSQNESGSLLDPATGQQWPIRREASDTGGGALFGAAFQIIDGRYLIYLSADGDLRAAPYQPKSHLVGRSVTLATGVRRDLVGSGQLDISATGMLGYVSGSNSQIRRLMTLYEGKAPTPLPVTAAPFLRFDLSPDRRWLAAVVQATDHQELLIYDLRNGQSFKWLQSDQVRHALWSPDGKQLVTRVQRGTRAALLIGSPFATTPIDTLFAADSAVRVPDPMDFTLPDVLIANQPGSWLTFRIDISTRPIHIDTLASSAAFASVSPDGRRLVFMSGMLERVMTSSFPPGTAQTQVTVGGVEPMWLSATEVIYRLGIAWYLVRIDPVTGEVIGAPTLWGRDVLFADTPGWSNRLSHDRGVIYVQGSDPDHANSIRLVPNWVSQMKRAVDAANK